MSKVKAKETIAFLKELGYFADKSVPIQGKTLDLITVFACCNFFQELQGMIRINPAPNTFNHNRKNLFLVICEWVIAFGQNEMEKAKKLNQKIEDCFFELYKSGGCDDIDDPLIWLFLPDTVHPLFRNLAMIGAAKSLNLNPNIVT